MPKIKSPTTLYCLRSRRGIAETIDVWKRTTRLKLKTLWRHHLTFEDDIQQPNFCSEALGLLHQARINWSIKLHYKMANFGKISFAFIFG